MNPVGVINEALARLEFAGEDPIGRRIKIGEVSNDEPWVTVVGVVRDFRHYRLPRAMGPALYYPYFSLPVLSQTLVLRTTASDPRSLVGPLESAVRAMDPIGLAGSYGLTRFLQPLLYQVSVTDPVTFVVVPLLLLVVALLAGWTPARRAAKVDPIVSVKAE